MFKKAIFLLSVISVLIGMTGCKHIDEYAKSSRKYNSRRAAYRSNNKRSQTNKQMVKHMSHYYRHAR